jgi:hypothetical protein
MRKNLFLFFEGLPENVIDSQVLLHCKSMKTIGVEFEIWAFCCSSNLYKKSLKRLEYAKKLSECEVKVIKGVRPAYPFSEKINASIVIRNLKKYNTIFDFIHSRTDYSSHVASLVTDNFIWDCRGDTLAEFEKTYEKSNNIIGKLYKRYKIANNIKKSKKAKKAIFVSSFLKNKLMHNKNSYVTGCAADDKLFFYDKKIRDTKRSDLNLSKYENVLIYSGGMSHYQLFPKTLEFFNQLNDNWVFIVLTTNLSIANRYLKNISPDRYIIESVKLEQVNSYLNASDVGIMLREKHDLNRSASPTKYAEYSMSGLKIIYSDEIGDLDIFNATIKNRIKKEDLKHFSHSQKNRELICEKSKKLLSKGSILSKYKKIYKI